MVQPQSRLPLILAALAGAAALALMVGLNALRPPQPPAIAAAESTGAVPAGCALDPGASIGGPIALIDHNGQNVTQAQFADGMTLVYFGYTYCPDVCPLSLQMEKQALAALGPEGQVIQPVLITLDPARDTPETLASYVRSQSFPPGLVGLTGSQAQIEAAAKAFRVTWQRIDDPESAAQYLIGHGSFFYLLDDDWRLRALFPSTLKPAEAAQCLRAALHAPEHLN